MRDWDSGYVLSAERAILKSLTVFANFHYDTEKFEWIYRSFSSSSIHNLIFRYGNVTCSVLVSAGDKTHKDYIAISELLKLQIEDAERNDMIPTVFFCHRSSFAPLFEQYLDFPLVSSYAIAEFNKRGLVNPIDDNKEVPAKKLSPLELECLGVEYAKSQIGEFDFAFSPNLLQTNFDSHSIHLGDENYLVFTRVEGDESPEEEIHLPKKLREKLLDMVAVYRMDLVLGEDSAMRDSECRTFHVKGIRKLKEDDIFLDDEGILGRTRTLTEHHGLIGKVRTLEDHAGFMMDKKKEEKACFYETIGEINPHRYSTDDLSRIKWDMKKSIQSLTEEDDKEALRLLYKSFGDIYVCDMTKEQKLLFAFAVYCHCWIPRWNPKQNVFGYTGIKCKADLEKYLEEDKKEHPERYSFQMREEDDVDTDAEDYALSLQNPLLATSLENAKKNLDRWAVEYSVIKKVEDAPGSIYRFLAKDKEDKDLWLYVDTDAAANSLVHGASIFPKVKRNSRF